MDEQPLDNDDAKVFVSYSRRDREKAQRISDVLRARHFGVFRDTEDILPTEEWKGRLEQLIADADTIVFLLSPASATSEVCGWEIEHATSLGKRIAPIVIEEVDTAKIPPALAKLNFIFATDRDPFENALDTLVSALRVDIDWIREHTRLGGLALRWQGAGRPGHLLLRGQDIADAEHWRDTRPAEAPAVTTLQADMISESRRAATRRQRMVAAGSLIGLGAAVCLSVFAWLQSAEADRQRIAAEAQLKVAQVNESRFLARRSVEMTRIGDHTAAAQIALMALPGEGGERPATPAGESALRHALSNLTESAYLPPLSDQPRREAAISSNGAYAAQSDGADRIIVTDLRTMTTVIDRQAPSWWTNFYFTPDGRFLRVTRRHSVNSNDGSTYELWDVADGAQLVEREGAIRALSPDGRAAVIVSGQSYEYRILVTDALTGQTTRVLAEQVQAIGDFSLDATGAWLLMKGRVRVEDTQGWYVANLGTGEIRQINPSDPMQIGSARWAADGTTLLTTRAAGDRPTIQFWQAPYDKPVRAVAPDVAGFANNVTLSPNGQYLDFTASDGQVIVNARTGAIARAFSEQRQIAVLPGAETFAMYGGALDGIEFHRLSPPGLLARVSKLGQQPQQVAVTADGRRLIALGWDSSVQVWEIPEFVSAPAGLGNRFDTQVRGLEFTADGATLMAHDHRYQNVLTADLSNPPQNGRGTYLGGAHGLPARFILDKLPAGRCPQKRYVDILSEIRGIARTADGADQGWACPVSMALSPDGGTLVRLHSRNDKFGVELQSTTGDFETVFLPVKTFAMNWIRFSPNGTFAMITPPRISGNGGVVLIDLARRALVALDGIDQTQSTGSTVMTSDDARLIAPTGTGLTIWDVATGKVIGQVPEQGLKLDPVMGLQAGIAHLFSDDRRLLLIRNSTGWIVDIQTGEILTDDIAPYALGSLDVSPDETLIAMGSYADQTVRVWSLQDGAMTARLTGMVTSQTADENGITAVAFSPDGALIAAGSVNGRVRVWSYPRDLPALIANTQNSLPRRMDADDLDLFGE